MILSYLFHIFIGFLSGSILYSYLWPKWICHIDITQLSDDHNPGTFNAMKLAGPRVGILCLVCDVCKGFFPLWFASKALSWQHPLFAVVLAAPVFGHAYSPFFHGRGGKAIAVSFGCLLGLWPFCNLLVLLAGFYLFFSLVVVIHPHRLRTVWVYRLFAFPCWFFVPFAALSLGSLLIAAVVILKNSYVPEHEQSTVSLWGRPHAEK